MTIAFTALTHDASLHMTPFVIMRDTEIGSNVTIDKSIIAENCKVGDNVTLGFGQEKPNVLNESIYSFGLVTIGRRPKLFLLPSFSVTCLDNNFSALKHTVFVILFVCNTGDSHIYRLSQY